MFETLKDSFISWNSKTSERAQMQQAYIVIAVTLLVTAGIVGLMNHDLGQNVLMLSILSAGMFLVNAVVWSLLQSAVISRIKPRRTPAPRKK
jgi:cell division protein FtsW (lipid II flippase)